MARRSSAAEMFLISCVRRCSASAVLEARSLDRLLTAASRSALAVAICSRPAYGTDRALDLNPPRTRVGRGTRERHESRHKLPTWSAFRWRRESGGHHAEATSARSRSVRIRSSRSIRRICARRAHKVCHRPPVRLAELEQKEPALLAVGPQAPRWAGSQGRGETNIGGTCGH